MSVEENLQTFRKLDFEGFNKKNWDIFDKIHAESVVITWPGQPEPTKGRAAHHKEIVEMFKTFPDMRVEEHLVAFGQGDWTCGVSIFSGTHKGPMIGPDGKTIPPTNKKFKVELVTVAHWKNGEIVEEKLFYDLVGMMRQLGLS